MGKTNLKTKIISSVCLCMSMVILISGCGGSTVRPSSPALPPPTSTTSSPEVSTPAQTVAQGTSVSVMPSVETVSPGGNFDLVIKVNTNTPTRGMQCILRWDPEKVQCNSAELGGFYTSFAQEYGGSAKNLPEPLSADNSIGKFPQGNDPLGKQLHTAAIFLTGCKAADGTWLGQAGTGDAFILHMTALPGASGTINFELTNVALSSSTNPPYNLNAEVINNKVAILAAK